MSRFGRSLRVGGLLVALAGALFAGLCFVPSERPIPPILPRESTEHWWMSRGYSIAYTRVAAENPLGGSPVLFLHGGPGGYVYTSTIETLGRLAATGRDVYLYDQIGSGLSDRVEPWGYSVLANIEDLREIIETHIGSDRVVLIGQSYGATLAAHFMALHPGLVERAVMTSPGGLEPSVFVDGRWVNEEKYPTPASLEFLQPFDFAPLTAARRMRPRTIASLALATVFNVKLMGDEEADGVLNALASRITKGMVCDPDNAPAEEGGGGFYAHYLGNWYGDLEDPRPRLSLLETPVLVLQGQCDIYPYAASYEFADVFPRGEYRFIEGAGHVIWWDMPDVFLEEILRFLQEGPFAAGSRPQSQPSPQTASTELTQEAVHAAPQQEASD